MSARGVVIDVYRELVFETLDARPIEIGTLDDENGVVFAIQLFDVPDRIGTGKVTVRDGNLATHDDLGGLSKGPQ
jgi:hypothetical protein